MAPIIEISNEALAYLHPDSYTHRSDLENPEIKITKQNLENFIYVPSLNLYFAKQRTHFNKNWFDCHKLLQADGKRMPLVPEFREFLKYLKNSNNQEYLEIYNDITQVK